MITLNWGQLEGEIGALIARFEELPRHIAKKHLKAAMKRAGKPGISILKKNTPVGGGRRVKATIIRGEMKTNYKRRGGSLRRAAVFLSKYKGTNRDGATFGILGYKYGTESRKAIWLEFGTARITPRRMVERSMAESKTIITSKLQGEMLKALEAATRELESGMNPGMSKRGLAAGVAPKG